MSAAGSDVEPGTTHKNALLAPVEGARYALETPTTVAEETVGLISQISAINNSRTVSSAPKVDGTVKACATGVSSLVVSANHSYQATPNIPSS